jgi:alkylhydroperoxidase/carboxymuconolactone decarboxylase family protein YurZ
MNDNDRRTAAKDRFIEVHGAWDPAWDLTLEIDPDFVAAYADMRAVPDRGGHLSPKFSSLVLLAVDAAATHLNRQALLPHLRRSLSLGASAEEILEVLELTATVGIHAMNIGVPLLVEVLEERGRTGPAPLNAYQERLREEFTRRRGYWHEFWDEMLELDPAMFEAYVRFSSVPWTTGPLSPAEKELIYISYDIAATHLYVPGTKLHIRNALDHGATVGQVLEVMELASMLGIQSVTTGAPLLAQALREHERADGNPSAAPA